MSWLDDLLRQHRINRAVERRLNQLEFRMALSDQALADLDAATNEIAAELDDLRGQLSDADQAVANRITLAANRLRSLAADPENPVPPADGGTDGGTTDGGAAAPTA